VPTPAPATTPTPSQNHTARPPHRAQAPAPAALPAHGRQHRLAGEEGSGEAEKVVGYSLSK
jgi:hypothetical protein